MIKEKNHFKSRLIIIYAILLQLITAIFIIFSNSPIRVARLGVFYDLFPNHYTGIGLMLVGIVLAVFGLFRGKNEYRFCFFLPQLAFLILTAGSALQYVFLGHYADGVIRSWQFIFVDQLPSFIAALLYIFAIFDFERRKYSERNT